MKDRGSSLSCRALPGFGALLIWLVAAPLAMAQSDFHRYSDPSPGSPRVWQREAPDRDVPPPRLLPPRAIIDSLAQRGYRDVAIQRVRGDSYIVTANGGEGPVLIVVDGHTTEIIGLRQLGWKRAPRQWDNDRWMPPRPWGGAHW